MATWIIGDIHGCSEELSELVERLGLGPEDRLLACGDLFHRGPDPVGVIDVLQASRARFILGNHERAVLKRLGLAPRRVDGLDHHESKVRLDRLRAEDLAGDGGRLCAVKDADASRVIGFLLGHAGYALSNGTVEGAGRTPRDQDWWLVHAGVEPGKELFEQDPRVLSRVRRLEGRGRPYWYEVWRGPELVLFGHTPGRVPRPTLHRGRLVALGLDTGCVYGGRLTAYSPELDEVVAVPAKRRWVAHA